MHAPETPHPVIIMAAPNGARRTKADHPALPVTNPEIVAEARLCRDAGAAAYHLHVRDNEGRHSLDAALYREALAGIRDDLGPEGLFLQITTEAAGIFDNETQMAAVRGCDPDGVSIAFREFVKAGQSGAAFADFLREVLDRGIAAQIILYEAAELDALRALADETGLDPARLSLLFVLGRYSANQTSHPRELMPFLLVHEKEKGAPFRDWMVCAFGPHENACAMAAALLGGHIRVGFENNLALANGEIAAGTHALAAQAGRSLTGLGMRPATAREARALFLTPPASAPR